MRTEGVDIDFRFIEDVQSIENIRRIVLRVSEGDITVIKSHDVYLRYYIELEGVSAKLMLVVQGSPRRKYRHSQCDGE
jgi:hypothetical protein